MSSVWLVPFAMWGAGHPEALAKAIVSETPAAVVEAYRRDVRQAMSVASRTTNADPEQAAPPLLDLYRKLDSAKDLPAAERRRFLRIVGTRLHELEVNLARRLDRAEGSASKGPRRNAAPRTASQVRGANPPGTIAIAAQQVQPAGQSAAGIGPQGPNAGNGIPPRGRELIQLIQETVAPETWDVNGGPGSMFYYHPVLGLVVRQTGEVHETVGGVLGGLR